MKISTDANILLRIALEDDAEQARAARGALLQASVIVIPTTALCELVWVAGAGYRLTRAAIIAMLEALTATDRAVYDEDAVNAGLDMLRAGGDFADGVIAFEGRRLGADVFVTFDRRAARRAAAAGYQTLIPITQH